MSEWQRFVLYVIGAMCIEFVIAQLVLKLSNKRPNEVAELRREMPARGWFVTLCLVAIPVQLLAALVLHQLR